MRLLTRSLRIRQATTRSVLLYPRFLALLLGAKVEALAGVVMEMWHGLQPGGKVEASGGGEIEQHLMGGGGFAQTTGGGARMVLEIIPQPALANVAVGGAGVVQQNNNSVGMAATGRAGIGLKRDSFLCSYVGGIPQDLVDSAGNNLHSVT